MLDTGTGTGTGTTCRVNTEQNYTVPDGRVGTRPLRQFRENVEIKELFHGFLQMQAHNLMLLHPYATGVGIHPNVTEKTRGHPTPLPPYERILWPPKSKYIFTTQQAT